MREFADKFATQENHLHVQKKLIDFASFRCNFRTLSRLSRAEASNKKKDGDAGLDKLATVSAV